MKQKRVTLANGIELDVVDEGPIDAPALIFTHGFPENHRTWRHQIAHFGDQFRCIAPDQRGYAGSSKPQGVENYTPDKLIGDVFLLADALSVPKFTIVGHDWGGAIAWGVALAGQHMRVDRAIIANAPHPAIFQKLLYLHEGQRAASQYIRGFKDSQNDEVIRKYGITGILKQEVNWDRPGSMPTGERERLLREWEDRDACFGMINYYRASTMHVPPMDAPYALPDGYTPPALPKLTIPTLVVWAMEDLALPPENLEGLEDIIDDLTIEEVYGCGHFVTWEAPDKMNAAMQRFLSR